MRRLTLYRYYYGKQFTLGHIALNDRLLYTIEDAWLDNAVGKSCIPDGTYDCAPRQFFAGGYPAIEVTKVPGRTHILIHRANTAEDVTGCIAVGSTLGILGGIMAVLGSKPAHDLIMFDYGTQPFKLEIIPVHPLKGTGT